MYSTLRARLRNTGAQALGALWLGAGAVCCAQPGPTAKSEDLRPRIDALIGTAACRDDSECRVVGVGARACGGPQAFLAWSPAQTSAEKLLPLVERDTRARAQEIERLGLASNCAVLAMPGVSCVRPEGQAGAPGRCTLQPAQRGDPRLR